MCYRNTPLLYFCFTQVITVPALPLCMLQFKADTQEQTQFVCSTEELAAWCHCGLGMCRLSYWIAGGLYATGFHIVNIFLHGVVSITFLFFVSFILGDGQSYSSDGHFLFPHPNTSLLAAVLFAIHPIHTESVSGDTVSFTLLLLLTYMCLIFYFIW